jgi:hypothetical protein
MKIICSYCQNETEKSTGEVNRAIKAGAKLYCDKKCSGLGRRKPPKTAEQKRSDKAAYDANRRMVLADRIKAEKAAAHQRNRQNPEFIRREKQYRKENMQRHVEYCRRPEYKAAKYEYDRKYRALQEHGEFWESFILLMDLRKECLNRMSDYDIRMSKGTLNKSLKRKIEYERRTNSREPEIGPMGSIKTGQRR